VPRSPRHSLGRGKEGRALERRVVGCGHGHPCQRPRLPSWRYAPKRDGRLPTRASPACAGRLVSAGPQDVPEACVGVDTSPRRGRAARRDLPLISLPVHTAYC
jgi:hypothetical protein